MFPCLAGARLHACVRVRVVRWCVFMCAGASGPRVPHSFRSHSRCRCHSLLCTGTHKNTRTHAQTNARTRAHAHAHTHTRAHRSRSVLCKASLFRQFCQLPLGSSPFGHVAGASAGAGAGADGQQLTTYHQAKREASEYHRAKELLLGLGGPFHGWIRGDPATEAFGPES